MTGSAQIIQADARDLPLADDSVDLIVTSPPYFALRSYQDGGEHYSGQIGSEATPAEFVDALLEVTRECVRVLKPSGSLWVNLGDKYAGSRMDGSSDNGDAGSLNTRKVGGVKQKVVEIASEGQGRSATAGNARPKSLIGIPWRYAIRCIDDLGLILRAEVIWCLSGGARVYARTSTGDRPIMLRDLVRAYRPEDVQLWNGKRWTQVLGWNKTPDDEGALELELRTGERIGCTPGHKWPTRRGVIRADEIRVGDVIETTRLPEPESPRNPMFLPDEDIGWLVGLYIAEGSRSGRTLQFAGHVKETLRHERLRLIARDLDGKAKVYQTSENGATCNLTGAAILGVIDRYVTTGTAKTKRLRASAWQRSDQFLCAVMDGYLSGDGHYDAKNVRWRLGFTANDEWAADMRTLAARTGSKISLRRATHSAFGRAFPGWRGEWRWARSPHRNAKQDGEVVAIRKSRARDFYDLGVADEPHLFALASGVLTHNSKPNGLPESVTDRVRRSHEQWFHFALQPRYFSAVDEIREPYSPLTVRTYPTRAGDPNTTNHGTGASSLRLADNPLGKLPGSVWTIPTEPLQAPDHLGVDHFAAFPSEWPRRIIQGWSPNGVCVECGEGRRPVATAETVEDRGGRWQGAIAAGEGRTVNYASGLGLVQTRSIIGYACACPTPDAPTTPSIILDPFGGTGTTALVAKALGRHSISVDMSADYCRLAQWRVDDPDQLAKAARVEKPPRQVDGQLGFDFDVEQLPPKQPVSPLSKRGVEKACPACGYRTQYAVKAGRPCEKCGHVRETIA